MNWEKPKLDRHWLKKYRFKKGHKVSEELKKKLILANKNRKWSKEAKQRLRDFHTNKKMEESTKEKLRKLNTGSKHPQWKGGITPLNKKIRNSLEYKLWRESVFKRDNYICIWCGFKGYVEADHIKPFALYPELRFAIDNGRTLCKECHRKTDTYGTIRNGSKIPKKNGK